MKIWHMGATEDGALVWLCPPDFYNNILIFLYYDRERVVDICICPQCQLPDLDI